MKCNSNCKLVILITFFISIANQFIPVDLKLENFLVEFIIIF